jgi:dephospho-CoA kinase
MIIGIAGSSGSGKSTVCGLFEKLGFIIVDFDKLTHTVYENNNACINEIMSNFEGVVENNSINRKKLAKIVFNDKEKLELLNKIVHKYLIEEFNNILNKNKDKDIILDAPLLFEAKLDKICNYTICVTCSFDKKIERIKKRDNLTYDEAFMRLKNQKDDEYFSKKCDFCLINDVSITQEDIRKILYSIKSGGENKK